MSAKIFFIFIFFISIIKSQGYDFIGSLNNATALDKDGGRGSLVFVFDTTGSMYNDLKQLRAGAEMILNTALEESNVIEDFVFVPFHDPTVGPATVTKDKEVFKAALNIVRVYGGGDCPEMSLTGILTALDVSRTRSFVYVFTDATAADHRLVGKVLDAIQKKKTQIVFVLTGHCNDLQKPSYKVYHQIAAASSGQVFNLQKSSVHKVLDFVRSSIKGRTVNLGSVMNPAGYNYSQEIPVDKSVAEVTVSVSGAKPHIQVVNPRGEITGPPQVITTLDLSEIMIVKVLQPEPGNWSVTVGSEQEHSVKVVGLSNLTFEHGFSLLPTTSFEDTTYRPIKGVYNHLAITLSDSDPSVQIERAQLLGLDGKELFEVPLKKFDTKSYVAEAFIPPDDFFNIAIFGHDELGQEIKRVGPTAVKAKSPDVPEITAPKKVMSRTHERVVLKCASQSVVSQTVVWTRDSVPLATPTISVNTAISTIEHVIEDMSEGDIGVYKCVATNSAGRSTAKTIVDLIIDPPQVNITSMESLPEHENLTIICSVFSEAMLQRSQIVFNGTFQNYAIDIDLEPTMDGYYAFKRTLRNVSEKDSGVYSCVASNRAGSTNKSASFKVQLQPTVKIQGPHTITKSLHSDVQFICKVDNARDVMWTHNNNIANKYQVNDSYTAVLNLKNVTEDGVWTCIATGDSYNSSDSVNLIVNSQPQVMIEGPKNITVLNGNIHSLSCGVLAKPAPKISWNLGTKKFLPKETNPEPNVYKSVIELDSQKESINGTYTCIAENSEGIDEDSVTVYVRREMKVVKGFTDTSVELYSQIEFHCDFDSHPLPIVTWYHNNTRIITKNNIVVNDTILSIQRIDFENLGVYECIADNGYENITISGKLMVHGLEKPILIKDLSKIVTQLGKETTIACRLAKGNPKPSVTWKYKGYTKVFSSLHEAASVKDEKLIVIVNASKEDAGTYRCIAENIMGQDIYDVKLIVQYPPEFNASQNRSEEQIEVKSRDRIELSCNVSGIPPPIVTWTRDGSPVTYSSQVFLTDENSIVIANATFLNSGEYRCNASSALGYVTKDFNIIVYEPPKISSKTPDEPLEFIEGELVELPCGVSGVPTPVVLWTHEDLPVEGRRMYIDEYGLRFVANVTDFGNYTCLASNEYGRASINYTVYIWVPPNIKPPYEVYENVQNGNNVHLKCDAVGFPLPIIMWEFQEEILKENTTKLSFDKTGNLYINNTSVEHDGIFTCVAENIAGTAKKIFYVSVNEVPKIVQENYTGPYIASNLDSALTIPCRAIGKPRPYMAWIKDGYYLDRDNRYDIDIDGTLTIKEPAEDISGIYTCIAKNSAGNQTKDVIVEIYSLPVVLQEENIPTVITAVEGNPVELYCPATNGDVKWYKDAKLIGNGTLNYPQISRSHEGTYACVARNTVGSAHASVVLEVDWPPMLAQVEERVLAIAGSDHYFECDADAKPRAEIKWLFNSKPIFGEDKPVLKVMNVKPYNNGVYECVVRNERGVARRRYSFSVLEPPFISKYDLLDVELKTGSDATLECVAKGFPKPTISWQFNNTAWTVHNATLTTTNVTQSSSGYFRCEAQNPAGVARLGYRVGVAAPAVVVAVTMYVDGLGTDVDGTVDLTLGVKVRLACKAAGTPSPIIQWIRYGNSISQNTEGISYADLEFNSVSNSDNGNYSCIASNEVGIQERVIKVNVLESPRIFQSLFHNKNYTQNKINFDVLSGQAFYLHCHPYGNPLPEVYWFKDGLPLKFYDDTMISTDFGEIVVSKNAKNDQSGNYTCVARNKVGEANVIYLVDVLVPPPQHKDSIKHVSVRINDTLNLTCPAEGRPMPYVMWMKLPYTVVVNSSRVQLLDDNYTMIITETDVSNGGKYSCIMTNKVGTTELIFEVVVLKPPSIVRSDSNVGNTTIEEHIVSLSKSIVLKCEADGNPPPKIMWYKDVQPISANQSNVQNVAGNSLVALWSVRTADAGPYVCVAENEAGTDNRRHLLRVRVPGKWSAWSQWSYCNVTCGLGYQRRTRRCQYIDDNNNIIDKISQPDKIILDESNCKGFADDRRKCHMPSCEDEQRVRGVWSRWSAWGACSAPCGAATQARARRCRGRCEGDNVEIRKCRGLPPCKVNKEEITDYGSGDVEDLNLDYMPEATFELDPEPNTVTESTDMNDYYIGPESTEPFSYAVNVTKNIDESDPGPCEPGYRYKMYDDSCEDIDECEFDKNECHLTQTCMNTRGAYRCSCPAGYNSLGPGQRCLDINECAMNVHSCEYACVNAAGGYVCACPPRLRLHADRHRCVAPSSYRKTYSYEDIIEEETIENMSRKRRH